MRLIDADAFIQMMEEKCDHTKELDEWVLSVCRGGIKSMPTIQPEQRTGEWIKFDMHKGMADHKCTACEQECYVPTCMGEPLYAFCPNCGSYNGGEQDG